MPFQTNSGSGYLTPNTGKTLVLGSPSSTTATFSNGALYLMPKFLPAPLKIVQIGVQVSVVGDVGCTVTPAIYADDGQGNPTNLLLGGTPVAGDVVGINMAACNFTLPAGWFWSGTLTLGVTTTKPSLYYEASYPTLSQYGSLRDTGTVVTNNTHVQSALAALPAVFAGGVLGSAAPVVVVGT